MTIRFVALLMAGLVAAGCRSETPAPPVGPESHADHRSVPAPAAADPDRAAAARVAATPAPEPVPEGMVWIPGGTFWMGCENCGMPDALPAHLVSVDGFFMDRTPVTNREFERFVTATKYATVAERALNPREYPDVPRDALKPGSAVFTPTQGPVPLDNPLQWWRYVPGASWRRPAGPGSDLRGREDHPVVHVSFEDVAAYAAWAGKRVPTEAEFEFAARGGLDRHLYPWGNELAPGGKAVANTWQGRFPIRDAGDDGFTGTSPVMAFPPNGFGLYDMGGNVWQWCADWYRPDYYSTLARGGAAHNPAGPADSFDPSEPGAAKRVLRGGSYLCTDQYCARYLVGSRGKSEVSSGTSNLGFRLVKSPVRPQSGPG
jgi:formylglycine-generating enzyme required for sulfatase activity